MKRLTEAQAKEYAAEGCTHPVRVFSAAQAAHYLSCLEAGEMSLHHTRLVHYSDPNNSSRRRIGLGVSYIPTSVRCTGSVRHTAMLMRGVDRHNHFDHEPRVRFDFDPEVTAFRTDAVARYYAARDEQVEVRTREFAAAR